MKKFLIIFFLFMILAVSSASAQYVMTPDYGIEGVIYLGNSRNDVLNSWGEPTAIVPLSLALGVYGEGSDLYVYRSYSLSLFFNKEDKLSYISASSGNYATPEGIRAGDSLDEVIYTYGNDYFKERTYDPNYDYRIRYEKLGFEFRFKDDIVTDIGIFYKK